MAAWTIARAGDAAEARALLDELVARRTANPRGVMPGYWITFASLALERVGRGGSLASLHEPQGSRFLAAALQVDGRRFEEAAATLRAIGVPQLEAETLVLAARERGEEAASQRARELLIGLGATARLRELDEESSGVSSRSGGT